MLLKASYLDTRLDPSIIGVMTSIRLPEPMLMHTRNGERLIRSMEIPRHAGEQFWRAWRHERIAFAKAGIDVTKIGTAWRITQRLMPDGKLSPADEKFYRHMLGDRQEEMALETELVNWDPPPLPAAIEALLKDYQVPCARSILYALREYGGAWDCSDMGWGKAQPKSEPVLTPNGWMPIGSLQPGDDVIGSDGRATGVLDVYQQGVRPIFKITFNDGTWTRCCDEHLWAVRTGTQKARGHKFTVKTLKDIRHDLLEKSGNMKWHIQINQPIHFAPQSKEFELDPYFLGLLLGDGCFRGNGISIASMDKEIIDHCKKESAKLNLRVVKQNKCDYRIVTATTSKTNPVLNAVRSMGLHKAYSEQKFIPEHYLIADQESRLAILQGLMDTDGWVSTTGNKTQFCTVSEQLANGVCDLVRGLGGVARVSTKRPFYKHKGERREGQLAFQISIAMQQCPFRLSRKIARWRVHPKYTGCKAIRSIEPAGVSDCVCIRVAASDHLYITRGHVLTHNTWETAAAVVATGRRPSVICPVSVKDDWKQCLRAFNVSPLFIETWEGLANGNTQWVKRSGDGMVWKLPENVAVIADEAQAARHAEKTWNGKMIHSLAMQRIPTVCSSATMAQNPSEMFATGAVIGLHDGTKAGFERFCLGHGCEKNGSTWTFDKTNYSALVKINRAVFPKRGARGRIETLGDKFPETTIECRMVNVNDKDRETVTLAYQRAQMICEKLRTQGDQSAARMAALQAWGRAYHAAEMVLVPYLADMMRESVKEGWHCPAFMNFDDTREALMKELGTSCSIHGSMSQDARDKSKKLFQDDMSPFIVCNLRAGGVGVSLHDTRGEFPRRAFILPFSQAIKMKQAFGRVQRTNGVTASQQYILWVNDTPQVQICNNVRTNLMCLDALNDATLNPRSRF